MGIKKLKLGHELPTSLTDNQFVIDYTLTSHILDNEFAQGVGNIIFIQVIDEKSVNGGSCFLHVAVKLLGS